MTTIKRVFVGKIKEEDEEKLLVEESIDEFTSLVRELKEEDKKDVAYQAYEDKIAFEKFKADEAEKVAKEEPIKEIDAPILEESTLGQPE